MNITFSSCFYVLKSKFDVNIYVSWMNHLLSIVHCFYLVIYTDENSIKYIDTKKNPRIRVIIKPIEEFYHYKYQDFWIKNHEKNVLLKDRIDWKLNMLWSEKIWFVKETIDKKYFNTEFYGWCDIGYFRNRSNDLHTKFLYMWPNVKKINALKKDKIYYALINHDDDELKTYHQMIHCKNREGLPIHPIPMNQKTIAGGFFILHKNKINWWQKKYEKKISLYFHHDYLVKDDQIILLDCIFSNKKHFLLYREKDSIYDDWFLFQRWLL